MISQLNRGVLEYCILLLLRRGDSHGYEIIQHISKHFDKLLDSTVYSIIRRLEKNGYVKTELIATGEGHNKKNITILQPGLDLCEEYDREVEPLIRAIGEFKGE